MTKTFCNRCNNEIKTINGIGKYRFYKKLYIPIIYEFKEFCSGSAKEIVLCESCIKSFESWFTNEI